MPVETSKTVRELAVELPHATRVFEKLGIDYCCGGERPLDDACRSAGVSFETAIAALNAAQSQESEKSAEGNRRWNDVPLAELIDHILQRHHTYVRDEVPRLQQLLNKVAAKHSGNHPELNGVHQTFSALESELAIHMMKEEHILFPFIVRMEEAILQNEPAPPSMFGSVNNPIRMMMNEHDNAGELLRKIRADTSGFVAPADGCTSFRALYQGLAEFETDLHQHIHLENNLLFPRALKMEGNS